MPDDDFDWAKRMGLARRGPHLAWTERRGALRWAPFWARRLIARAWNHLACRVRGHDWFPESSAVFCSACSRRGDWTMLDGH